MSMWQQQKNSNRETQNQKYREDWRTIQNFAHVDQEPLIWITTMNWGEIQRRGNVTSAFQYTYMDMKFTNSDYQNIINKFINIY